MVYGPRGSGQTYLGPAILHHLEGFHVQSFDLATLMSDSTRTTEAAIVQLFVEAKRHQPSIIFIPSLSQWSATVSETARSTTRALLDGIPPSDPVLLLAIVDGELSSLPSDVRSWFGFGHENRLELNAPSAVRAYLPLVLTFRRNAASSSPNCWSLLSDVRLISLTVFLASAGYWKFFLLQSHCHPASPLRLSWHEKLNVTTPRGI